MSALTPKQQRFVEEYLKDLNATQAAIRAGYSEKTAQEQGSQNLSKLIIANAIQARMDKRSARTEITSDLILKELLLIARADISQAYDEKGNLKPMHDIPEDVRRAMSAVKVFEEFEGFGKDRTKIGDVREVKFWDKPKALELLGRHLKLFTDKVEHSGSIGWERILTEQIEDEQKKIEGK